jgi:hypothetical protein
MQQWTKAFSTISGSLQSFAATLVQTLNAADNARIRSIEKQLSLLESRQERELLWAEAAGASEEELATLRAQQADAQAAAEEAAEQRKAQMQTKMAKRQKAIDLMSATTGTASAIVGALGMKPFTPFNLAMAGIVGGLGAAQIGMIAAQPIPAYATGGDFMTNGPQMIMVGDNPGGRERVRIDPQPDNRGGNANITVNISGVVGDREAVASWVAEGIRRGQARGSIAAL